MSHRSRRQPTLQLTLLLTLLLTLPLPLGGGCQKNARQSEVPRRVDSTAPTQRVQAPRAQARPKGVPGVAVSARWWTQRHAQKVARARRGGVDLLWIGDSITHFWESDGKGVWDRYYATRRAVNLGFSGDRVENVLWRIRHGEVAGISPRVAVVMIGTNDAGYGARPTRTAAHIRVLVTELRTRLPRTKILLLAIFPCGENDKDRQRTTNAAVNRLIAKLHDGRWVHYQDLGPHFLTKQGVLDKSIMPDLLHPGAKGYLLWAKAMEPTLKRLWGTR